MKAPSADPYATKTRLHLSNRSLAFIARVPFSITSSWAHPQFNPIAFSVGAAVRALVRPQVPGRFRVFLSSGRILREGSRSGAVWSGEDAPRICFMAFCVAGRPYRDTVSFISRLTLFSTRSIFAIWQGGMSVHGGMIGCPFAMLYFKHCGIVGQKTADFVTPLAPGVFLWPYRQLHQWRTWGRVTTPISLFAAMIFPNPGRMQPRHPSQLYEAGLEGIVLFLRVMWFFSRRQALKACSDGAFLPWLRHHRFWCAWSLSEPDSPSWAQGAWPSLGQWLSLPLILLVSS